MQSSEQTDNCSSSEYSNASLQCLSNIYLFKTSDIIFSILKYDMIRCFSDIYTETSTSETRDRSQT